MTIHEATDHYLELGYPVGQAISAAVNDHTEAEERQGSGLQAGRRLQRQDQQRAA